MSIKISEPYVFLSATEPFLDPAEFEELVALFEDQIQVIIDTLDERELPEDQPFVEIYQVTADNLPGADEIELDREEPVPVIRPYNMDEDDEGAEESWVVDLDDTVSNPEIEIENPDGPDAFVISKDGIPAAVYGDLSHSLENPPVAPESEVPNTRTLSERDDRDEVFYTTRGGYENLNTAQEAVQEVDWDFEIDWADGEEGYSLSGQSIAARYTDGEVIVHPQIGSGIEILGDERRKRFEVDGEEVIVKLWKTADKAEIDKYAEWNPIPERCRDFFSEPAY